jgi:DNA helicase IV
LTADTATSSELDSLIKETVETYLAAKELWSKVIEKGKQEGYTESELQDIAKPLLKGKLTRNQVRYVFQNTTHRNPAEVTQAVDYALSLEFYKELDAMADLEKESKDSVSEAIKIAKQEGFSNQEIEQLIREYLKDSVPKDMLDDWLNQIS